MSEQPESQEWWPAFLAEKDDAPLLELAERFGVRASALAGALVRTGTPRRPSWSGASGPPTDGLAAPSELKRPGSKDDRVHAIKDKLGKVPDRVAAQLAGVSQRTITSFRKRHGIAAFQGRGRPRSRLRPGEAPPVAPEVDEDATYAWRVRFADGGEGVVTATTASEAARSAEAKGHVVLGLDRMGRLI